MENLIDKCTQENKLHPSLRRHIHGIGRFVVKIPLKLGERDYNGDIHDPCFTRFLDQNAIAATILVDQYTSIPIPKFVHTAEEYTVWEYVEGVAMETAWEKMAPRQIEGVKYQLRDYISQLWSIPHPCPSEFAVGTLCFTHELLNETFLPNNDRNCFDRNGPFKL